MYWAGAGIGDASSFPAPQNLLLEIIDHFLVSCGNNLSLPCTVGAESLYHFSAAASFIPLY